MSFFYYILLFIIFLVIVCWHDMKRPNLFPPGPKWLPLIGTLIYIRKLYKIHGYYHLVWNYLAIKYGSIVGLRIGKDKLIIVSGKDAIKEFYNIDEFNGRPNGFFFCIRYFNKKLGIVFRDGDSWDIQRKFSIKILRELGMGRQYMKQNIECESMNMIEFLQEKLVTQMESINSINIGYIVDAAMGNIMWSMLAGCRFNLDDDKLLKLLYYNHETFRVVDMSGGILNQFPFIRYFAPVWSKYRKLVDVHKPLHNFIGDAINRIKKTLNENEPNCFIEHYLIEIERCRLQAHATGDDSEINPFNELQLISVCLDIFQAGVETTSNTITFGIIYMLYNLNVQKKVRKELDRIVGLNRLPNLDDRLQLPYTEATTYEIIRMSNVAPLGLIHRCMKTVRFGNYIIPEGTLALVSLYGLNMDTNYWKDPMEFRPERFLDCDGKLIKHDNFIPFGMGKRRCMGENLAKSSLFLFFATIMHAFEFNMPDGDNLPDLNGYDGITLSPKPYKIVMKRRAFH